MTAADRAVDAGLLVVAIAAGMAIAAGCVLVGVSRQLGRRWGRTP